MRVAIVTQAVLLLWAAYSIDLPSQFHGNENFFSSNETVNCVPVMALGLIDDPRQFALRLFASIDHCVDNMVVVIPQKYDFRILRSSLVSNINIRNITFIRSPHLLFSVSEGWNMGLKAFPTSNWFLVCNYDVEFMPGQLKEFSFLFEQDMTATPNSIKRIRRYEFAHVNWQNIAPAGYNLFAISRDLLGRIGYFDENFFPAFFEDSDFEQRILIRYRGGIRNIRVYMHIKPWHGVRDSLVTPSSYVSGTIYLGKASSFEFFIIYVTLQ
jgi:hypothetical protein